VAGLECACSQGRPRVSLAVCRGLARGSGVFGGELVDGHPGGEPVEFGCLVGQSRAGGRTGGGPVRVS
jgi:hypothetical protein